MMAALQQQLIASKLYCFFDLSFISFDIGDVCFCMTGYAIEITEFTVGNTYVGSIYVAIDLPGNFAVGHLFFAAFVGHVHQLGEGGIFKKEHAFFYAKKFEIEGFLEEVV